MSKIKIAIETFQIPYEVFENSKLRELSITIDEFDFGNSEILKPGYLSNLKHLKNLDLTGIIISEDIFKNEICNLLHLEQLTLMYSKINSIPHEISNLKKLKSICFRGNDIKELPSSFFELQDLKEINFIDNKFESILEEISKMKSLVDISFRGNPHN